MTREEFEFMRGARATLYQVQVPAQQATQLFGTSSTRIAVVLFASTSDYDVSLTADMTQRFQVKMSDPPLQLLVEHLGDFVQQGLWVWCGQDNTPIAWVETVAG
jgi:hypothetical protein